MAKKHESELQIGINNCQKQYSVILGYKKPQEAFSCSLKLY